ncbi:hypothetical protein ACLE20_02770 [Rhizobium sp. YIM 134829]|uniref:hypothetical protein n=1 Tax=Rhizobium sp. YIM 134829 TaxID=3390453 RepID=UPI00397B4736
MTTLVTVLKSGGRYDARWVDRLQRGARQSIPSLDRVVCLSDLPVVLPGVETIPLRHDWPAWWAKFEAFRPEVGDDLTILCDLDTVFSGDASAIAEDGSAAMEDYFLKGRLSTALMRWHSADYADLYETFEAEPERWMKPGSCGAVPNSVHGDQVVVDHLLRRSGRLPAFLQQRHPGLLDFYDREKTDQGPIIIFIGDSKPDKAPASLQTLWYGPNDGARESHGSPALV